MYQVPHHCDGLVVKSVSDRRHTKSSSQKPALLLCLIASLFFVTGCGANRGSDSGLPAAGDVRVSDSMRSRSCSQLTSDANAHIAQMKSLAAKRTEARRTIPKTVLSGLKRAIGRSDSAHALSQQYAEQRTNFTAANAALKEKGCPVVELPLQLQVTEPWTGQT
jgi:hypothetical protein